MPNGKKNILLYLSKKMNSYFKSWVKTNLYPWGIVYSTDLAKNIIGKKY